MAKENEEEQIEEGAEEETITFKEHEKGTATGDSRACSDP